jgi:ubiquinone/menaquinone biosynthesis C-methylase UbiE
MSDEGRPAWGFAASTGLGFTHHGIVDAHFRACEAPYRQLLGEAGIQPRWRVLDAGCGGGDFLPWLAALVGPGGSLSAIDLAPENAALAAERVRAQRLPCAVEVRQGSLLALPYDAGAFDAVWCANTVQYLNDAELAVALGEMRRVVRPGGVVAVKDLDAHLVTARPADPYLFSDFFRAAAGAPGYARQLLRNRDLYRHLKRAGLRAVSQRTLLIEHYAPLSEAARAFYKPSCASLAAQARALGLSPEWDRFADPDGPANPLEDPDGYISEGNVLAVGIAP